MKTLSAPQLRTLRFLAQDGARIVRWHSITSWRDGVALFEIKHPWQTLKRLKERELIAAGHGVRPWITVYTITDAGRAALLQAEGEQQK
jgi:hypothetical protein